MVRSPILAAVILVVATVAGTAQTDPSAPGPWLVFDFAIGGGMGGFGSELTGAYFAVQVSDGGPFETLFRAKYDKTKWYPYAVNLTDYAGKDVRVRFVVEHINGRIAMDYPYWGNPRILVGPLLGEGEPKEVFNFAMAPIDNAGAILPDGTEVPLTEEDPVFYKHLVTPGRLNRELMLLVYAGDAYICVPGKSQPGIYMGVSQSVDYLRVGAGPEGQPWTGKMPPPVFAEWQVTVPSVSEAESTSSPSPVQANSKLRRVPDTFQIIQHKVDIYKYSPGLVANYDAKEFEMDVNMGPETALGWAFVGVEAVGITRVPLAITTSEKFIAQDENSFAGLLVDYHTPKGYQKRVYLGLGAGSGERYDLRAADWILNDAALRLESRLGFRQEFVDVSEILRNNQVQLDLELTRYAPSDWDGRFWLGVGVQNVPTNAGLAVRLVGLENRLPNTVITGPHPSSDQFVVLENDIVRYAISRTNGAICAGWDKVTGRKLMAECNDQYRMEKPRDVMCSTELLDRIKSLDVKQIEGRSTVVATCENIGLPAVTITKRYMLSGKVLSKRVAFSTSDPDGFFIHYDGDTKLNAEFMAVSSRGGGLKERKVVAKGEVVTLSEDVALEQVAAGDAPMAIANDYSVGLSTYRYRVNDRFVSAGNAGFYSASKGTPQGWTNRVFVDYLRAGQIASGELHWVVFRGDFTAFARYYQQLPSYRELYRYEHPEWVKRLGADEMCMHSHAGPFYEACQPLIVDAIIWFLNPPWGNYWPDSDPPLSLHPSVYSIASRYRQNNPNAKVSAYTIMLFDEGSDVYKNHPEFGVRDIDGDLITSGIISDSTGGPSFNYQINNPACREYLLAMHTSRHRKWQLDFHYMDGGSFGTEIPDWQIRDVAQWYDWIDYLKELRHRIQQIDPDGAIWVNGVGVPYADIGYVEWRDPHWQQLMGAQWRSVALDLFRMKLNQPPGQVYVPTYGGVAADPAMSAYDIIYGWCGHQPDVGRVPWMKAAWEFRGVELVPDAVKPRWWRQPVDFEAYGLRKDKLGVVHVFSHMSEPGEVEVSVDAAKLGLEPGKPLYGWMLKMNDPRPVEDVDPRNPGPGFQVVANLIPTYGFGMPVAPDQQLTEEQKQTIRIHHSRAASSSILLNGMVCPKQLMLRLPTRPVLLTTVVLSHTPAVLESVDGRPTETGLTEHLDVTVTGGRSGQVVNLTIDCHADSATVLVPGLTVTTTHVQAGIAAQIEDATWAGGPALRIALSKGRHQIQLALEEN